jgi:hypothetical protein
VELAVHFETGNQSELAPASAGVGGEDLVESLVSGCGKNLDGLEGCIVAEHVVGHLISLSVVEYRASLSSCKEKVWAFQGFFSKNTFRI